MSEYSLMTMSPHIRKFMLTSHVTSSVAWIGALVVFLAHAITGLISQDEHIVRATSLAMGLTAWYVILPLSFASLITGIIQSMGTAWGLFRHYWVFFKLLLTAMATLVLILKSGQISFMTEMATEEAFSRADFTGLQTSLLVHSAGGLLILLSAVILAIYKPSGLIRYRIRREYSYQDKDQQILDVESAEATPRWVKVFGFLIILLILIVGIMMLVGGH